jgi:hypothetical protein
LIVGASDPRQAVEALGRLAGPLEPDVTTLLSVADDDLAAGLYQALLHTSPSQLVLLGVPGANPVWTEIEVECRRRGIILNYASGTALVETARLRLILDAPTENEAKAASVTISRGTAVLTIAFGTSPPAAVGHVLVTARARKGDFAAIVTASASSVGDVAQVVVDRRERVRIEFQPKRLRIFRGTLLEPRAQPTPTTGED